MPERSRSRGSNVSGRVFLTDGRAAAGAPVRLYGRGFGGSARLLGETKADEDGSYKIPYPLGREASGIELRTVGPDEKEIALTKAIYDLGESEALNVVAPSELQPLESEFARLNEALEREIEDLDLLADAREQGDQRDLTLLRQGTGWDARVVALAARARAVEKATGLPTEMLYGLFRAGLPHDPGKLAMVPPEAVGKALAKVSDAGVIKASRSGVKRARASFEEFARKTRLEATALVGGSSIGELLADAPVGAEERAAFEKAYFQHRSEPAQLWKRARENGVSKKGVERLQRQGKLAYLTLNNAPLTQALQKELGTGELEQLVDMGLYEAAAWKEKLEPAAGKGSVYAVPDAYAGEDPGQRLDAYAADLARQVRLSFPTRVVGDMVERGTLPLVAESAELRKSVARFLKEAPAQGFELGQTPVEHFVRDAGRKVLQQATGSQQEAVIGMVKTIQRLYQITPSDHALGVLLEHGFTSADDVLKFHPIDFIDRFGSFFHPGEDLLVSTQAQQVGAVSYTFYGAAKQIESTGGPFVMAPGEGVAEAKQELLKQYPTLEGLFGSLDFCECESCRSVLSPAAYLVDLLQFVNPDDLLWKSFVADWNSKHPTDKYEGKKHLHPYEALKARRPDLANLPLTCENTNTALPYIDLVNEILEHFVAEGAPVAHDTGEAESEELLAEPQNTLAKAYGELQEARYPLALPFDLWTETVRRFFDQFELPLWKALEIFRPSEDLFPPKTGTKAAYYRASAFTEQLGLVPAEYKLLTDPALGSKWFELYGFKKEPEAKKELVSAKRLSRRLGVTYKELIELVGGGFVNPRLHSLVVLRKLGIEVGAVFRYKGHPDYPALSAAEKEAFEERLAALSQEYSEVKFDARKWLNSAYANGDFDKVLVLADPDAGGCDFEKTTIRYADGSAADPVVFLKLNVLVRLRRRLGWTLEETDRALQVLIPSSLQPLSAEKLPEGLRTALLYMAHLKTLAERVPAGKGARLALLTFWSPLSTGGKEPLYAKLFLSRSVARNDPVFDHPLGEYLTQKEVPVKDHLTSLQGALGLTAEEIEDVLADAGQPLQSAELSLSLVSLLYRYRLLSTGLKISVRELIALKGMTGLDPFRPLDPAPLGSLEKDHPLEATLAFVNAVEAVRDSGFSIADLEYLLRHRADPVGEHRPDPAAALALVRTLGGEIQRIRAEHAVPAVAAEFTDEVLGQKLALIYPPEVTDPFLAMWAGTAVYEAFEGEVAPGKALAAADFAKRPEIGVSYDEKAKVQRLTHRGVLLKAKREELEEENPSPVLAKLLQAVEAEAKAFFERELAGFLAPETFDQLFAPLQGGKAEETLVARRDLLARTFLPFLQRQLIHRLVVQALATELDLDPATVEPLVADKRLLVDPTNAKASLLDAFAVAGERGLSVEDLGAEDKRFAGVLEVPATGSYGFYVTANEGAAEVELRFDHLPDPVLFGSAGKEGEAGVAVELVAGAPYAFSLRARKSGGKDVNLLVQAERLPRGPISRLTVVPGAAVERVRRARTLLAKVGMLITTLGLGERELRHLVTHPADFDELDLNALPTVEDGGLEPAEPAAAAAVLFGRFTRLAAYAKLKRELEAEPDGFVEVWEHARRIHPKSATEDEAIAEVGKEVYGRIAALTRRDVETVAQTAEQLGMKIESRVEKEKGIRVTIAPGLVDERGLCRLWEALAAVELLGAPAASVARWTKVVSAEPAAQEEIARDLRNVTRARYEPEAWQRVARPVFDTLRQRQRDALVAHIMDSEGFDRVEQLFEYFLVDPGMEPVVQTSRIQLAIASVQLFVQRCLLNLEPGVHPRALVNARHWSWMKRYRVWEANRKLFLYPENWLEPEFRDDKSNLFSELEGTLLGGDITEELAEDAFFGYLKGLEKLAKLDVVSTYVEEKPNPVDNVLHVIGRTHSLPHEYFYRRYAHQVWMPWEPIEAEIESDHVAVAVWRERLHVFWVTFMEQAQNTPPKGKSIEGFAQQQASFAPGKKVEVQLHWTERFEDSWTTREAGAQGTSVTVGSSSFRPAEALIHVSKEYPGGEEGALRIHLGWRINCTFRIASKNSAPTVLGGVSDPGHPYTPKQVEATRYGADKQLGVDFNQKITTEKGSAPKTETAHQKIAALPGRYQMLRPSQPLQLPNAEVDAAHVAALVSPFFISDSQNTFYVEPKLHQQTFEVTEKYGYELEPVDPGGGGVGWIPELPIIPVIPEDLIVIEPHPPWEVDPLGDPDPGPLVINPGTIFEVEQKPDWTTSPGTVLVYGETLLGGEGLLEGKVLTGPGSGGVVDLAITGGLQGAGLVAKAAIVGSGGADMTVLQSMALKGGFL